MGSRVLAADWRTHPRAVITAGSGHNNFGTGPGADRSEQLWSSMANGSLQGPGPWGRRLTSISSTRIMFSRITLACLAAAGALSAFAPTARAQSVMDRAIYGSCSKAMASDFQKAGKTAAPGLIDKTCSCVVQQINATHNIDLAKTICSKKAIDQMGG